MDKDLVNNPKKFMFDLNDFDEAAIRRREAAARRPTFSQEEMAAARQTGFDEGRIAGMQEAVGSQEAQIRDLLNQVVAATDRLAQDEADRMATFIDQAALISVQALSKALPALLDAVAIEQIAAFVNGVLEEQVKSQTLTIYVAPAREPAVHDRLESTLARLRRRQSWAIAPDPAMGDLQCRMEWSGGGAEWDPQEVASRLLETITAHLPEHLRPLTADTAPGSTPQQVDAGTQTPHTDTKSGDA